MKRPFQFYPSNWSGTRWVRFDGGTCSMAAPTKPACYVVYLDGELAYIGQTTNLRRRLANHGFNFARYSEAIDTPWGQYQSVQIKARFGDRFGDWGMRELRLIERLRPRLNCIGSQKPRARAKA